MWTWEGQLWVFGKGMRDLEFQCYTHLDQQLALMRRRQKKEQKEIARQKKESLKLLERQHLVRSRALLP
jgi:hypothetical protein